MYSYLLALLMPLLAIISIGYDYPEIFLASVLTLIPALDLAIGNAASACLPCVKKSGAYWAAFYIPHVYQTLWLAMLAVAGYKASGASPKEWILIAACCGYMAALVSAPAHEFMHRDCEKSRIAAALAFAMIGYGHYTVLHHIHHVKVGLERFGSAPARGVSIWRHIPISLMHGLTAAWRAEYRKHRHHPFRNQVLRQWLITVVVGAGFFALWGVHGLALFCAQAMFAIFFIETVGYMQHYGLQRDTHTPCAKDMAWDSNSWLSNRLLLNNPLHAHHHRDPRAVFMALEPCAPMLPAGYFPLIFAVLVPPLWRVMMDRRVSEWERQN